MFYSGTELQRSQYKSELLINVLALKSWSNSQMKQEYSPWEIFAKKNDFTFIPGSFFQTRERIEGLYRGYWLKMSHWRLGVEIVLNIDEGYSLQDDKQLRKKRVARKDISHLITTPYPFKEAAGFVRIEDEGCKIFYHHLESIKSSRNDVKLFQEMLDPLCQLGDNYRKLLRIGGATVPTLEKLVAKQPRLSKLTRQLLHDIGTKTTDQLGSRVSNLLCSYCLTRFQSQNVDIPGLLEDINTPYIGCRICHQSQSYIECEKVVALLDNEIHQKQLLRGRILHVNWLKRRTSFDFDWAEIVQATDEDVERFAVQVGNDTDSKRGLWYRKMYCFVSPNCQLSENTMRILHRMFGFVQIKYATRPQ